MTRSKRNRVRLFVIALVVLIGTTSCFAPGIFTDNRRDNFIDDTIFKFSPAPLEELLQKQFTARYPINSSTQKLVKDLRSFGAECKHKKDTQDYTCLYHQYYSRGKVVFGVKSASSIVHRYITITIKTKNNFTKQIIVNHRSSVEYPKKQ